MVVRTFELHELLKIDLFNDGKDTVAWLMSQQRQDLASVVLTRMSLAHSPRWRDYECASKLKLHSLEIEVLPFQSAWAAFLDGVMLLGPASREICKSSSLLLVRQICLGMADECLSLEKLHENQGTPDRQNQVDERLPG